VCEQNALISDDYGRIIAGIIQELKTKAVPVRSTIGDVLPPQVVSLAHWSEKSLLKGADAVFNGIKWPPCLRYFIQLVIADLITWIDDIRDLEAILQGLVHVTNSSEGYAVLRIRCPQYVKAR
jgi:hypothetical protein